MTSVLPFAALMCVQTAEIMLAFVLLSSCKIFISGWMLLTAQQQTCPIINWAHSTISPGKNTSVTKLNLAADALWVAISD